MNLWCFVFGTCSLRYHNLRKNMGQTSHPHPLSQIGVHGSSKDQKEEWAACTWTVKKPKLSVDLKDVDVSWRTVDGRNPANQLRLVVYPIIYRVLYIPGGGLGFLNHQQHIFHQKTFDWFGCKIEGLTFDTCPEAIDQMFSQEPDPCTVSTPPKQNIWKSNRCLLKTTPFVNFLSTFLGVFFLKSSRTAWNCWDFIFFSSLADLRKINETRNTEMQMFRCFFFCCFQKFPWSNFFRHPGVLTLEYFDLLFGLIFGCFQK